MPLYDRITTATMKAVGRCHVALYRRTRGRVGRRFRGGDVLLLTVTGRKSGRAYTYPLMYVRDGNSYVVAASNGGVNRQPAWWLNLRANAKAEVLLGGESLAVTAEQVPAAERAELWRRLNEMYSGFDGYARRVDRTIDLVRLTPAG
jgi:deazaflavin-dependent oxidoreductase (nitroreductase family)